MPTFAPARKLLLALVLVAVALPLAAGPPAAQVARLEERRDPIPAEEFSRLSQEMSEEDGYFRSDNFTSNETSYLHVVDKLRELVAAGGAYVGVGPEQNFTYIAKIRPRIAFIVDIRRQAVIQHLLYKAAFHRAENRAQFLSLLLSRPLTGSGAPGADATGDQLMEYFARADAGEETFMANLAAVRKTIQEDFRFPLGEKDRQRLEYVYGAFRRDGLEISFRSDGVSRPGYGGFPSLRDLVLQRDQRGNAGNFLTSEPDYRVVRQLQLDNRVIPVVGDFAGSKALASVGGYLTKKGYRVAAFYTSNVEQFLFQNGVFAGFVENVKKLPIDERSLFIRAVTGRGQGHPAYIAGHRTATVLQKIGVFLSDQEKGLYPGYWEMVTSHFIAGDQP